MAYGPELVVPNISIDGVVDLIYSFTGTNDDGGVTFMADQALVPDDYSYSFNCLNTDGEMPMHVRIAGVVDLDNGHLRGATAPGVFNGTISITQNDINENGDTLLLSVTGTPTVASAKDFSVRRII